MIVISPSRAPQSPPTPPPKSIRHYQIHPGSLHSGARERGKLHRHGTGRRRQRGPAAGQSGVNWGPGGCTTMQSPHTCPVSGICITAGPTRGDRRQARPDPLPAPHQRRRPVVRAVRAAPREGVPPSVKRECSLTPTAPRQTGRTKPRAVRMGLRKRRLGPPLCEAGPGRASHPRHSPPFKPSTKCSTLRKFGGLQQNSRVPATRNSAHRSYKITRWFITAILHAFSMFPEILLVLRLRPLPPSPIHPPTRSGPQI